MKKRFLMLMCALTVSVSMAGCALLPFSDDVASSNVSESGGDDEDISLSSKPEEEQEPVETEDVEADDKEEKGDITTSGDVEQGPLEQAKKLADQYDYDGAIELLRSQPDFDSNSEMTAAVQEYEATKATCTAWPLDQVTHVFYHTLVYDTSKAFDGDDREGGYNQVMTTVDEFNKITQSMYEKGFVMVSLEDMAKKDENGVMVAQEILLPPGKQPFVLSQDDVSYYHYMDGDGMATKLILDENGDVKNEYLEDDGSISVGDYDMVPLIDKFVDEHPDFSYKGAKGTIALTGYNGVLGYRTDRAYKTLENLDENQRVWLDAHPDFNWDNEVAEATKVADAMKEDGWEFASHTWGHINVGTCTQEHLETDTQKWLDYVAPIVGGSDKIIFAFGADITGVEDYSGPKFDYLKSVGFDYYCNVDSSQYWVQLRDNYLRMGRRNLDGYRMYYNPDMLADLFDASAVFDPARPTPVPEM